MIGRHTAAVTDFAWSKDALTLLACSRDGTVVAIFFDRAKLTESE